MSFKKRVSGKIVPSAKTRLSAMKQIDTDNGNVTNYGSVAKPLTALEMKAQIDVCENDVTKHNQLLEQADAQGNIIDNDETKLKTMFAAVLKSAVGEFGEDSNELQELGGTRKSDRKRPVKKPKTP